MNKGFYRRMTILRQAAKMFYEQGYMGSSLRELARRCGIQGASIYHHFSSKEEILFKIMDFTWTTLIERLKENADRAEGPLEKLEKAIRFHIKYHIENPYITHVTDAEFRSLKAEYSEIIARKRGEYEVFFEQMLREGIAVGLIEVENIRLARIAILQISTGVTIWFREADLLTADQVADAYIQLIRYGIIGGVRQGKKS